ncbi:MAG: hypothetical protein E7680_06075 [Ruminococcaceae bacterium]|nr:hypothetical protein [Oscillospiraceae bacterium]
MKERKSCIPAILSFLLVLGAIAAIGCILYNKIVKKKLQAEEADLLEGDEETDNDEVEDLSEIVDGEEA